MGPGSGYHACGKYEAEIVSISWFGPNCVHILIRDIDNIVVNQDISQVDKTLLEIERSN